MTEIEYLREACLFAAAQSGDPSTQNGAVIVSPRYYPVFAANSFPPGVQMHESRTSPPYKYSFVEHAERAAIYACAAKGVPTAGATLYCPWFACTDCARAIILAGIREVVGLISLRNATPGRWLGNIQLAETMLAEAGVSQRLLADSVGVTIRFDGRDFQC